MHSSDFIYIDVRWREDGWHEAMKLRLLGWLPEHLVLRGVDKGVIHTIQTRDETHVTLTARGIALTDPGPYSFTKENCQQLVQVLREQGESDDWLQDGHQGGLQLVDAPLNAAYRKSLLAFLRPVIGAKNAQR